MKLIISNLDKSHINSTAMQTILKLEHDQDWLKIERLDMELIFMKIMSSKHLNWSFEETENAIREYRKFLFLRKKHPNIPLSPTKHVDEIWHTHILFTRKYFADCNLIFGSYLHHTPHTGMSENVSAKQFENTKKLYRITFGVDLKNVEKAESGGSCSGGTGDGGGTCGCGG